MLREFRDLVGHDNFNFIRKGVVGDWKNFFEGEEVKKWDEWIENNRGTIYMPVK